MWQRRIMQHSAVISQTRTCQIRRVIETVIFETYPFAFAWIKLAESTSRFDVILREKRKFQIILYHFSFRPNSQFAVQQLSHRKDPVLIYNQEDWTMSINITKLVR